MAKFQDYKKGSIDIKEYWPLNGSICKIVNQKILHYRIREVNRNIQCLFVTASVVVSLSVEVPSRLQILVEMSQFL